MTRKGKKPASSSQTDFDALNINKPSQTMSTYSLTAKGLTASAWLDPSKPLHEQRHYGINYYNQSQCCAAIHVIGYKANEDRASVEKIDLPFPDNRDVLPGLIARLQRKYGLPSQATGATFAGAVVSSEGIHTMNIGDSAVLTLEINQWTSSQGIKSMAAKILRTSNIHNLSNPAERERIEARFKASDCIVTIRGTSRLRGIFKNLAGSRTIGDQSAANSAISRTPDFKFLPKKRFLTNATQRGSKQSYLLLVSDGITDCITFKDSSGQLTEDFTLFENAITDFLRNNQNEFLDSDKIAEIISIAAMKNSAKIPVAKDLSIQATTSATKNVYEPLFDHENTTLQDAGAKYQAFLANRAPNSTDDLKTQDDISVVALELTENTFQRASIMTAFISDGHAGKNVANHLIDNAPRHLKELIQLANANSAKQFIIKDEIELLRWSEPMLKSSLNQSPNTRILARVIARCINLAEDTQNFASLDSIGIQIQALTEAERTLVTNSHHTFEEKLQLFEQEQNRIAKSMNSQALGVVNHRINQLANLYQQNQALCNSIKSELPINAWINAQIKNFQVLLQYLEQYSRPRKHPHSCLEISPEDFINPLHVYDGIITACDQIETVLNEIIEKNNQQVNLESEYFTLCYPHIEITSEINRLKLFSAICNLFKQEDKSATLLAVASRIEELYQHTLLINAPQKRQQALFLLLDTVSLTNKHIITNQAKGEILIQAPEELRAQALNIEAIARKHLSKPRNKSWYIADVLFALTGIGLIIEAISFIKTGQSLFASRTKSTKLATEMAESITSSIKFLSPAA